MKKNKKKVVEMLLLRYIEVEYEKEKKDRIIQSFGKKRAVELTITYPNEKSAIMGFKQLKKEMKKIK